MKIFFGEAHPAQYEDVSAESLFRDPVTGQHYYYMLDQDEEGCVRLYDTCNRMVPFDIEQVDSLAEAVYILREVKYIREEVQDRIDQEVNKVVVYAHDRTGVRVVV